ncbi:TetR/AcrR family transcriptional regulator [Salipiger abyssi]|uniref:TetR/AcrR family transcriptional regulator n=1 Tax=Salipiger abyssi TaxID=1250539 RepID=UPI00405996E4
MARPQAYNTQQVLDAALTVFWTKGYDATSLQDLLAATKLSKSSLYGGFGDKHGLFLAAFDTYREARRSEMLHYLAQDSARAGIEAFFRSVIGAVEAGELARGCMSVNQAVEMSPHDPLVHARVESDFHFIEEHFAEAVARGQAAGEINPAHDPKRLGRMLLTAFAGFQVLARARCARPALEDALAAYLGALD